ncbi:LacI family DNA-binding transcriptional regulator [Streptomyces coryli]|uniref:LacI family DNA-binding transcriptional regulator n=1 Tax=Streptomyces coryli TaxID=1128680 RepID=UPI0030B8D5C2
MSDGRRRRAPNQADVARLAGVSQSAVSRVVSGNAATARIPEETRQRVFDAVKELGYVANPAARAMRNKRNNLLGVHTFEPVFPRAHEDFHFPFLLGIEERAEETDYDLVLFTATTPGKNRRPIYRKGTNRLNLADGTVLLGESTDRGELARLWYDGYTFIHIGRREVPGAEIPCVIPDYESATERLVERLADRGHRRVAYLRALEDSEWFLDRRKGYAHAVRRLGLTDTSARFTSDPDALEDWFDELAAGDETAVVVETQWLVGFLEKGLAARGLRIPEDISVALLEVTPTEGLRYDSLEIPRKQIGRIAVDRLIAMLDDPDLRSANLLVPCPVVPGDSIGAPSARPA